MAIPSLGVGSGLPLDDLLTGLRSTENNVLKLIQNRQIQVQNRLSAYGKIQSSLEALKDASQALGKAETFGALKSNVNNDAFTASASSQAIAGKYSITVDQLASSQSLVFAGTQTSTEAIGTGGTLTITLNDGSEPKTLDLAEAGTSLDDIVAAINKDSSLGINATIINDGSDTPYRLLLTASKTGEDASVASITVADNAQLQGFIGVDLAAPDPSKVTVNDAQNAILHINDIEITSQYNEIDNAIEGVELTLSKTSDQAGTLSISRDDAVASKAVNAFVSAYNNLQTTIRSLTAYNADTNSNSALTGDSLARRVQNQVRAALNVATASGAVRSLSQLGIKTNPDDGTLQIDDKKLAAALDDHLAGVQELFSGEVGITTQLKAVTDSYLSSGGMFSTATDSVNRTITDLQKQYDTAAARIDAKMENYRRQFTNLDTMVAQMNSVSSYLTQQLSMLGNQTSNNQ